MPRSPAVRAASLILLGLAPLLFAAIAVLLGKEASWDFQNYHWYTPFALFNQRLGFDIAVAHHATYYNPLLDVPLYWLAQRGPAWLGGVLLGALYGVAVNLVGAIAYQVLPLADPVRRLAIAVALALTGAIGGGAFPSIGNTSNDVPVAIGTFAALLILVANFAELQRAQLSKKLLAMTFVAGFFCGMSVGLKLTTAIYAPGLVLAVMVGAPNLRKRSWCVVSLSAGMLAGIAVFAGYWMARMWEFGHNPVFPYFNQLFHSPLLVQGSYRDPSYFPKSIEAAWLFPFYFTANSYLVAEWDFCDARILAAYVLVPLTLVLMAFKRINQNSIVKPQLALFLFVFASVSYLAWLMLFCIYRYVIPLEMLCPILVVCAVMLWPLRRALRLALLIALFVISQSIVKITLERQPWGDTYVSVAAPTLPDPQHSMILLAGVGAPSAFVIPYFPRTIPFLRIDGWLVHSQDRRSGLAVLLHQRVAAHHGSFYMLFAADDRDNVVKAARDYELAFAAERCQLVSSTIAQPLELCRLVRLGSNS